MTSKNNSVTAVISPTISIVVAMAKNNVIGAKGGMPWKLSSDLKRFKRDTMGKPIIMGRKTWESIGRPLPGRPNIVVTRNSKYVAEGASVFTSLDAALQYAAQQCETLKVNEICLIGGGQLYKEAIDKANRLYVTHVMAEPDGDTWFPEINSEQWKTVINEAFEADDKDSADTRYTVYDRIK